MVTEEQYINYFSNLAANHNLILHQPGVKEAFFFIPLAYDLSEIDKATRNMKSVPCIALDALKGAFNDNSSENNVQMIHGQLTILDKIDKGRISSIREVQDKCLRICVDFITRLKHDSRKNKLFNPAAKFAISNIQYDPVGPWALDHYGYTIRFEIACPFGYKVDSGTWLDK